MSGLAPGNIGPFVQSFGGSWFAQDNSGASWIDGTWWQQLQPGSWRGCPFVMLSMQNKAGRRTTVHEYPYRDTVWVEDLGKLPRRFGLQAFLVGDDVYQQRDAMLKACETAGAGTLVHPTMGSMQCVLVDFAITDRVERGRYVDLSMAFVLASDVLYPTAASDTAQQVQASVAGVTNAAAADLQRILGALPSIPDGVGQNVAAFCHLAESGVNDAARAFSAVRGLIGYYGRYAQGSLGSLQPPGSTVASALADCTTQRSIVLAASRTVQQLAGQV
jgi:prophage DNA circulation protein